MARYSIYGQCLVGSTVTVYDRDTMTPSTIYNVPEGGSPLAGGQISPDSYGVVLIYIDTADYAFMTMFDVLVTKAGAADIWRYDVWNYFNTGQVGEAGATPPAGDSMYTLADYRSRLAVFFSSDETDSQVKAVLNECIQTGYEKVVSTVNMHSQQVDLVQSSVANQREYPAVSGLGIPTYVGYKGRRLRFRPYEVLREMYANFSSGWDPEGEDPIYYSLKKFDGSKKILVIAPSPKESDEDIYILCFQQPGVLSLDTDYPLIPPDWAWLVLERAKIERLRFEGKIEEYQIQGHEFAAYMKVMIKKLYPAAPDKDTAMEPPPELKIYNQWRMNR